MQIKSTANRMLAVPVLLAVSCLWGMSFVAIRLAADGFESLEIAALRVGIAALCLLAVWLPQKERLPSRRFVIGRIILLAFVGQIVPFVSLGASGQLTDSSSMAVMMGFAPLATLAIGCFLLSDERLTWTRVFALAVGFAGVVVSLGLVPSGETAVAGVYDADLVGKLLAGLAALGYAAGAIISRSITREMSPLGACTLTMTLSAVLLWTYGGMVGISVGAADAAAWGAVIALGVVNTALAYAIYFWLIAFAGATFASLNNYLVPIAGVVAGSLILDEEIGLNAVFGLGIVLFSIFVFSRSRPREILTSSFSRPADEDRAPGR